ncbi:integral membrane protein [Colletotrichum plurivorum]|uniref:Integral membrane protein n=1 Tax=Colletotrichum plurivorum TaxID=2175906 RepID=A0A8H6JUU2_9PEZI|nr:integral membrane protein [Colletotrichum plurivorum]
MKSSNPVERHRSGDDRAAIERSPTLVPSQGTETPEKPLEPATKSVAPTAPSSIYAPAKVVLVKHRGRWVPPKASRLRNSLLSTMGLLELANAGDFAANVWNEIPVPIYAIVFMALGGTLALVVSVLAYRDAMLSWDNVCYLRQERRNLKTERERRITSGQPTQHIDVLLDMNFRELGSEVTNRFGLDIFSGFGAFVISIGTYMAIGGASRRVWFASNLLSGYIGNAPIALYGVASSLWSGFIFIKATRHRNLAAQSPQLRDRTAKLLVGQRSRNVHIYTSVSAVSSLVGGVASMITATRWWGYVMLIPVILSSMFYNSWLRRKVAYDRPAVDISMDLTVEFVARELELADATCREIQGGPSPMRKLLPNPESLESVVSFLVANDILEACCIRLLQDEGLVASLADQSVTELEANAERLFDTPKELHSMIIEMAQETIKTQGPKTLIYRQRYLAELLGTVLRLSDEDR